MAYRARKSPGAASKPIYVANNIALVAGTMPVRP